MATPSTPHPRKPLTLLLMHFSPVLLSLAVAATLAACGGASDISPTNGSTGEAVSTAQSTEQVVLVQLTDAATGLPITQPVTLRTASEAGVTTLDGRPLTNGITTSAGEVYLKVNFATTDNITLLAGNRENGIVETGVTLGRGGQADLAQPIEIRLLSLEDTFINELSASPTAIGLAKASVGINPNGSLQSTVVSTASKQIQPSTQPNPDQPDVNPAITPSPVAMGTATLSIPEGTLVVGESNQPVAVRGPITASVAYYSPLQRETIDAYPGGFAVPVSNLPAGAPTNGTFITGGFGAFNLTDADGQALKRFSNPLTLTIDTPKTTINQETGLPLQPGDAFPIFSFEETTGQWTFEQVGTVTEKPGDSDNYQVVFNSSHLTAWNLDYYQPNCVVTLDLPSSKWLHSINVRGFGGSEFFTPSGVAEARASDLGFAITDFTSNRTHLAVPRLGQAYVGSGNADSVIRSTGTVNLVFIDLAGPGIDKNIYLEGNYCGRTLVVDPPPAPPVFATYSVTATELAGCTDPAVEPPIVIELLGGANADTLIASLSSEDPNAWVSTANGPRITLSASLENTTVVNSVRIKRVVNGQSEVRTTSVIPNPTANQRSFNVSFAGDEETNCQRADFQ